MREVLVLALILTPCGMLRFGDLLSLSIPMVPKTVNTLSPASWPRPWKMRLVAFAMLAVGLLLVFFRRRARA
ncbi:MAG: hypothetical protein AB7I79_22335 [Rhizobiaceae bacterium]